MPTPKEIAQKILRSLYINAHGDSADAIRKYQGKELPGLGIIYPQLKELAQKHEASNEVTLELLQINIREARITGLLLADPNYLELSNIQKIKRYCVTEELENHFARNIIAPLINKYSQEFYEQLSTPVLIKGLIQSYRINRNLPEFEYCIDVLKAYLTKYNESTTDILNLIESIFRCYETRRSELHSIFQKMVARYPSQSSQIELWLSSLEELQEIFGDNKS